MKRRARHQPSVQNVLPLRDMQDGIATMIDGSLRGYLHFPGKNQSLITEAQSTREALLFAAVLSSIKVPFEILKYPMPISSSAYLVQIDRAIARERQKMFATNDEDEARTCQLKITTLENHMRPDAKREATCGDRFCCPTYVVLKFPAKTSMATATRDLSNLMRIATEKLGKTPKPLNMAQFIELCGMYFTPQSSGAEGFYAPRVILPKMD